jgi:hypothetical protein
MKMKKILRILIPALLVGFLLVYDVALKKENDMLLEKFMNNQMLLEKVQQDLKRCSEDSL